MKKLLLILSALTLCACKEKQPAYKEQFISYLEKQEGYSTNYVVITIDYHLTEYHLFDYDYVAANVYYNYEGKIYKDEYLLVIDNLNLYQVATINN